MGWLGDAQVFAKTAIYNYNTKKFFSKWLGDLRAEQRENGSVPDTVPNFWLLSRSSTAWGDAMTVIPWQLYLMYGDKKDLEVNFDAMKRWVDFMTNDSLDRNIYGLALTTRIKCGASITATGSHLTLRREAIAVSHLITLLQARFMRIQLTY